MKAKFYIILIESEVVDSSTEDIKIEKVSFHFGGFTEKKLFCERDIKESNIPNAIKYDSKQDAENACKEIKDFILLNQDIFYKYELYIEEIEAEYQINSVLNYTIE